MATSHPSPTLRSQKPDQWSIPPAPSCRPAVTTTTTTSEATGATSTVTTTVSTPDPTSAAAHVTVATAEVAAPAMPLAAGVFTDTVCVTGAAGYCATETIKQLLERGYSVRGTVRAQEASDHLLALGAVLPGKIELFEADLCDANKGAFDRALTGCSTLFHMATNFTWEKDPFVEVINPAVEGTKAILASAQKAGVSRVVMTSSTNAVFDPLAVSPLPPPGRHVSCCNSKTSAVFDLPRAFH